MRTGLASCLTSGCFRLVNSAPNCTHAMVENRRRLKSSLAGRCQHIRKRERKQPPDKQPPQRVPLIVFREQGPVLNRLSVCPTGVHFFFLQALQLPCHTAQGERELPDETSGEGPSSLLGSKGQPLAISNVVPTDPNEVSCVSSTMGC